MKFRAELLVSLREAAVRSDCHVVDLIEIIREGLGSENADPFSIIYCLMEAFSVGYSQLSELPGAMCMGGGVYTNDEIQEIIWPYIEAAVRGGAGRD